MNSFYLLVYFTLGIVLAFYWWTMYYEDDYRNAKASGEIQDGMAVMTMLLLTFFWPIVALYRIIKGTYEKFKS